MTARAALLAANTARSKAYAQALLNAGLTIEDAILFQDAGRDLPGAGSAAPPPGVEAEVFLPDLAVSLDETCGRLARRVHHVSAASVNDSAVQAAVAALDVDLVIYSGFGGQIVGGELLALAPRLLHVHAGWLPEYRGSTTTYYSLLNEGKCGVSALLLASAIDAGEIVGRRWYPAPPAGLDIDYLYDSAIRADLLVEVLRGWSRSGEFGDVIPQSEEDAETYYVIHPVLKHLAILGLDGSPQS